MILHDYATVDIKQGNTLANPPFSDERWSTGLDAEHDPWQRFKH